MYAVDVQGVAKRYARVWALRDITFQIARGELVCLFGPNGSGKSTLLRILATLSRPTRGSAHAVGHSLQTEGDLVRSRIGFLGHRPQVYAELSAVENLRFAAVMYGRQAARPDLRRAVEAVGLGAVADVPVRGYSQGMVQRLALARATLHDPELLLLDEPFNALDAQGLDIMDRLLDRFAESDRTVLLATHWLDRVEGRASRVLALAAGRLVSDGPFAAAAPDRATRQGAR
jgi:heme exporter protein A